MDVEVPPWMNRQFAEETLRKSESDETIRVTKIAVNAATSKGDNYTSEMYRMYLEITRERKSGEITEKMSVLVKVAPTEEGPRRELVYDTALFSTEISMMSDTLRKMNQLLGPDDRVSANCIFTRNEPPALLVMEDLAPLGFRMACRQSGLDLEHCLVTVRNLAKYHASSVALCEAEPIHKSMYHRGIFSLDHPPAITDFFNDGLKSFAESLATWPDVDPKYPEKLLRLSECAYRKGVEAASSLKDEFNVLTHGDCWVNNMLFKYDDSGKITGHIFVDFQMSSWRSPALDLQYFMSTSLSEDVETNHFDLLLEEYAKTLASTMKRLGCETAAPSLEKLKVAMKHRDVCGMIAAIILFPLMVSDKSDVMDMNEMMVDKKIPVPKNEQFRKVMLKRLEKYERNGLLDL